MKNEKRGKIRVFSCALNVGASAPNPDTKDFSRKVLWNLKSFAKMKWCSRCESFCTDYNTYFPVYKSIFICIYAPEKIIIRFHMCISFLSHYSSNIFLFKNQFHSFSFMKIEPASFELTLYSAYFLKSDRNEATFSGV